jgi:uncharacterized membrane protein YraQ (UPF0718 family)
MSDRGSTPPHGNPADREALRRSVLRLNPPPRTHATHDTHAKAPSCCGTPAPAATPPSCCGGGAARRTDFLLLGSLAFFLTGIAVHAAAPPGPRWLLVYGHTCHELVSRTWWGLLIGIAAVAVIGRLPRELVAAVLGRGGSVSGLFRAVGAGVLLDLCNHGILMVGMSLYKRGASLGQTLAFLIASPWNSLSLTLILAALIGWGWMLAFIALSIGVALITGWTADLLVRHGKIPANPNRVDLPRDYRIAPALRQAARSLKPSARNCLQLAREGLQGSTMILRWIFFGFVLTALIRAFVPEAAFQQYFGPTIAGLFLTLLATTLIEVCSEGSSPIAADLLTRANAPGNAFVFLMAGAATDHTEILSLRETTRSWKATLALPLLSTPQVILIGWLIHQLHIPQ